MLPTRKHSRRSGFDYSTPGAYFVTICTHERRHSLGHIKSGQFHPSPLGRVAAEVWQTIPQHRGPRVRLDAMVVMPNHLHGIIWILPAQGELREQPVLPLGNIVGGFKGTVSRSSKARHQEQESSVFQAGFWDHVIRHEKALHHVREYILNNPRQWSVDMENARRTGENEFYRWIEAYSRTGRPGM